MGHKNERIILANSRVEFVLDPNTGAILTVRDIRRQFVYSFNGIGFIVETDNNIHISQSSEAIQMNEGEIILMYNFTDMSICLHYSLGVIDAFVEKWIEIRLPVNRAVHIIRITLEDVSEAGPFNEIHFHDDQTIWHCPINLFFRSSAAGCYGGLEYPYWELTIDGNSGFRLGYTQNTTIRDSNVSEKYFLGICAYERIYRYSHGPYPGMKPPLNSRLWENSGLNQQFRNGRIPDADMTTPEMLDWGEVWAMQEFMKRVLPEQQLPESGYWIFQNGWWAGLFSPREEQLDLLNLSHIHDVMTAHMWLGHDLHPNTEPAYISSMSVEAMGFPFAHQGDRDCSGETSDVNVEKLHSDNKRMGMEFLNPDGYGPEFLAPKAFEEYIEYGRALGVNIGSFSTPNIYFYDKPEWGAVDADGNICKYLFDTKISCPACDEYMAHLLKLYMHIFDKYGIRYWAWDGRWLSYNEAPYYLKGPGESGFDPCYAEHHGHVRGDNLYKEWVNIRSLKKALRNQYPSICLELYYGMKRGGPWSLSYLNCDENYYETGSTECNRYQNWHNQNDRFRPSYLNYASIMGEKPEDFKVSVLSCVSNSTYAQVAFGFRGLSNEENREFLNHWRKWASDNSIYLKMKRDLFDCPGYAFLDGSAHIVENFGYLFIFNAKPDAKIVAEIPMDRYIGLDESEKCIYEVSEIYPAGRDNAILVNGGDDLHYDVSGKAVVLLQVRIAGDDSGTCRDTKCDICDAEIVRAF